MFAHHADSDDERQNRKAFQRAVNILFILNQAAQQKICAQRIDQKSKLVHQRLRLHIEQYGRQGFEQHVPEKSLVDGIDSASHQLLLRTPLHPEQANEPRQDDDPANQPVHPAHVHLLPKWRQKNQQQNRG